MLENSKMILKKGYTIFLSNKDQERFVGTYLNKFERGMHVHELPQEELNVIRMFPNIMSDIMNGKTLQVHQQGRLIISTMGYKRTEGPYCENEYLEVTEELIGEDFYNLLFDLNMRVAEKQNGTTQKAMQYKKLYKGVERYE